MTAPVIQSVASLLGDAYTDDMKAAFPDVDPPFLPFGYNALFQMKQPPKKVGSIILPDAEKDVERQRTQAALCRALGPVCFRDRTTFVQWREGAWYGPGSFCRVPMYGGDRFYVKWGPKAEDVTLFAFFKEADAVAAVTGDPLSIKTS